MSWPERQALWAVVAMLIGAAESVSWNPGRGLLGVDTTFNETILDQLNVPKGARMLVQSEGSCGDVPPVQFRSQRALACSLNDKTRECLKVSSTVPFFNGTCSGRRCIMNFLHAPVTCFFQNFGVDVDVKNASRRATCGFRPEESFWLKPGPNPFALPSKNGSSSTCVSATPPDVSSEMWAPCRDGEPRLRLRMTFKRRMAKKYTCVLSHTCIDSVEHNKFACFVPPAKLLGEGVKGPESRAARRFSLVVVTTLAAVLFALALLL